jgi:hypothetical protein
MIFVRTILTVSELGKHKIMISDWRAISFREQSSFAPLETNWSIGALFLWAKMFTSYSFKRRLWTMPAPMIPVPINPIICGFFNIKAPIYEKKFSIPQESFRISPSI